MKTVFKGLLALLAISSSCAYAMQARPALQAGKSLYEYSIKRLTQKLHCTQHQAHELLRETYTHIPLNAQTQREVDTVQQDFNKGLAVQQTRLGLSDKHVAFYKKHNFVNPLQAGEYRATRGREITSAVAGIHLKVRGNITDETVHNAQTGSLIGFIQLVKEAAQQQKMDSTHFQSEYQKLTNTTLSAAKKHFIHKQFFTAQDPYRGTAGRSLLKERTEKEERYYNNGNINLISFGDKCILAGATAAGIVLYNQ